MRFYFSKFKNFIKIKGKNCQYDFWTQQEKGNLFKVQNNHKENKTYHWILPIPTNLTFPPKF